MKKNEKIFPSPKELLAAAQAFQDTLVAWRRDIHAHPELGFDVEQTAQRVERALDEMGVAHNRCAGTGVVATIEGDDAGETIGLRADMDALPLDELTGAPYASKTPGRMHACGHDAHTACLLGAAKLLSTLKTQKKFPRGRVLFFFQPAEETDGGALPMIQEGILEKPHFVKNVFALHVTPHIPTGTIEVGAGVRHASSDMFDFVVEGKGCHGAHPEEGIDALYTACQIVSALQSVVSRNVSPTEAAVVTIGRFHAGNARNIIPERAELGGTLRALSPQVRERVRTRFEQVVSKTAEALGAKATIDLIPSYPCLANDDEQVARVRSVAAEMLGADRVNPPGPPSLGVEDFAYFAQARPSAFFDLGIANAAKGMGRYPLHNPRFDLDEDALPIGAAMLTALALSAIEE